jgi:hypothetical protein
MRYICLGYTDENIWNKMSESEQKKFMDECFEYEDALRKNGQIVGGEALQDSKNAATLRWENQRVSITDGPFTETKEQLGGIMMLEAVDLNHAIQIMSKHPSISLAGGSWEIRPAADLTTMMDESSQRRAKVK